MFTYLLSLTSFCQKANYFPNDQRQNMEVAPFVKMNTLTNSFLTEGFQLVYLASEVPLVLHLLQHKGELGVVRRKH